MRETAGTLVARSIGLVVNVLSLASPRLAGRVAFAFWGRPRGRARIRPTEQEVHGQARIDRLDVDGNTVVAYAWGDGENPVLMVHGWESRASRFAPYVPLLLALGFSPVTFDTVGHGDSGGRTNRIVDDREVIHLLYRRYGHFSAVIAHSIGVLSAFYALRTGATTSRLVVIGGPSRFGYLADEFKRRLGLRERVQQQLRRHVERMYLPETDIWERFSPHHRPATVGVPILVVHDEDDEIISYAESGLIMRAYRPNAELVTTRGLGHRRVVGDEKVVRRTIDFVAQARHEPSEGVRP
ncbi:MAG TPA: alpha/beta hydrolase [Micromonosporaceae bacterium]|nr:alpha/beta hydrolase [Micromonosporaceae bacterium]